jgi:hypothetical protein
VLNTPIPAGGRAIITADATPVKINGVSEEPAATPDPAPEGPSRYDRSFGGLIAAMVVTVLFVAAYVGFRALTRDQPEAEPASANYLSCVADLQGADAAVVYPVELPAGWIDTSVAFARGTPPDWRMGILTDRGEFVGVVQQASDVDDLLSTYVDKAPTAGQDAAPANSLGATSWQTWSDSGGDHAFSTVMASGSLAGQTLLVYGSAPVQDQEALISLLTLDPVPRQPADAPACDSPDA